MKEIYSKSIEKDNMIKQMEISEKTLMKINNEEIYVKKENLKQIQIFIEENFINKRKEVNANKAIVFTFLSYCLLYFIFSWLKIEFNLKTIALFLTMCGFIWFNAWFIQKVINQKYDKKISLKQDEKTTLFDWIIKNNFIYIDEKQNQ